MEGEKKLKGSGKNQKISPSPCKLSSSSSESDNVEEDSVNHKNVRIIPKSEKSKYLPEDMTKYATKFFQRYFPENNLEKNVTKYNPAPTKIGRSKDVDNSYLAATSVK